ncbi:MAG: nucleotide disphospho-sugar-binding domain-containing protein [Thermoleophilaceae bacterium]
MARILAYTSATPGHVFPIVGSLLELSARGHDVHVRTQQADVERLAALGLSAAAVDPRIEEIEFDDWRAKNQVENMRRMVELYERYAKLELPDVQRAIGEVRPDAVMMDIQCEGGLYATEASGLPWAIYCPYPPPLRSVDAPPHGMGMRPPRGRLARLRNGLIMRYGDRRFAPHVAVRNEMRAGLGLPPLRAYDDQWCKAGRFLALTAEPYEYPRRDWHPSVRLVGPGAWDPPAEPPRWLEEETRPVVLVSASTAFQDDARLIAVALEGLADEPVSVVATTAANDPAQFTAPANARVEAFVPHGPVMARSACVVTHGGMGTTQKALAAGVPVCVVPFCRDQFDVARRVEAAAAGVRLHHKRLTPKRLKAAVHEAIAMRPGAERVARAFAAAGGSRAAADEVEQLLPVAVAGRAA